MNTVELMQTRFCASFLRDWWQSLLRPVMQVCSGPQPAAACDLRYLILRCANEQNTTGQSSLHREISSANPGGSPIIRH
jgi:hypothetical protein